MKTKTETPSKTVALQFARAKVSALYRFGDGYKFNTLDAATGCWRESNAIHYHVARHARAVRIAHLTADMLEIDAETKEARWSDSWNFPDLKSMIADIRPA